MKTNFKIIDNIGILISGNYVDLHNDFDFAGLIENKETNQIQLNFTRTNGHWVNKESPLRVQFKLFNVSYLLKQEGNRDALPTDKNSLSEVSFCPSVQREVNTEFYLRSEPLENDDILFCFVDGSLVRVGCEMVFVKWPLDF